jgi:hypothetical protein
MRHFYVHEGGIMDFMAWRSEGLVIFSRGGIGMDEGMHKDWMACLVWMCMDWRSV